MMMMQPRSSGHCDAEGSAGPRAGAATAARRRVDAPSGVPNSRQRVALQALLSGRCKSAEQLQPIGPRIIGTLLARGWIEEAARLGLAPGYRITATGRSAFLAKVPIY